MISDQIEASAFLELQYNFWQPRTEQGYQNIFFSRIQFLNILKNSKNFQQWYQKGLFLNQIQFNINTISFKIQQTKQKKTLPSPKGQIEIKTQRTSYYSNETIIGWVFLTVKEPGFMAGIVQLRFVGKDKSTHAFNDYGYGQLGWLNQKILKSLQFKIVEQDNLVQQFNDQGSNQISQLNKKFINSQVQLHDFGNQLPLVKMVFPFEIALNLCASSLKMGSNQKETIIEFYLVAEVVNKKNKLETQIKFKLPIYIQKSIPLIPQPLNHTFRDDQYDELCCFRKKLKNEMPIIKITFPKNQFSQLEMQQETMKFFVEIDQSSGIQDLYISIFFFQKLQIQFPLEYENIQQIDKAENLKCQKGQKIRYTFSMENNEQIKESTAISTYIQLQYFFNVKIINTGRTFQFPISMIEREDLQVTDQIYNYVEQTSNTEKSILFDNKARLVVNQSDFLQESQILQLQQYDTQLEHQING